MTLPLIGILIGGLWIYSAVTGTSVVSILQGKPAKTDPFAGVTGTASAGSPAPPAGTAGSSPQTSFGNIPPNVIAIAGNIGKQHGWTPQEMNDWFSLMLSESNLTLNDTNSSSGAYGIAQMLAPGGSPSNLTPNKNKYYNYGGNPNTFNGQLTAMANYIIAAYGNPSAAWAFHQQNNWY